MQRRRNERTDGCVPSEILDGVELCCELGELLNDVVHHDALLEPDQAQVLELPHGLVSQAFSFRSGGLLPFFSLHHHSHGARRYKGGEESSAPVRATTTDRNHSL